MTGLKKRARPLVSVIVVTLNTPRLTRGCLQSVTRNTSVPYELIVVNNSRAQAIRRCLRRFPAVRRIQNPRNLGYTRAANRGARASRGEYLCFLNSDTLVPPGWMERLLKAARGPRVGAVGPGETSISPPDGRAGRRSRGRHSPPDGDRPERAEWLRGFCLLIPKKVTERVGLFDERFFFGRDDADYSLRLRLAGYRLLRLPSLVIHHQRGGSAPAARRERLLACAWLRFLGKWRPWLGGDAADYLIFSPDGRGLSVDRERFLETGYRRILDRASRSRYHHRHEELTPFQRQASPG